jgi:formylglycine-generating enzyme required for sulfatase activity
VYAENVTALPFAAFGQSSPRYTSLQAFPGTSPNGSFLLPNGAPITFSGVNQPRHASAVMPKIEALAALVQRRWGHLGYRLRVTSAKRDPVPGDNSYHQYGRGIDFSLARSSGAKLEGPDSLALHLDQVSRLCVEVGFDWVWHHQEGGPSNRHVHASMHTGGPSISGVAATGGALIAGSTTVREWTVTGTASDPDGVWQVLAVVRPGLGATADVNWATQPVIAAGYDSEVVGVVPPQSVPFSFTVRGSVNAGGDATVHLLARDTFGSVVYLGTDPYTRKPATVALPVRSSDLPNVSGMVRINPGTFQMGSNAPIGQPPYYNQAQAQPVHPVTITRPFLIGQKEVTQAQYQAVMFSNPSYFPGANRPVEQVTWNSAMAYCAALTASEAAQGRVPSGYQYRLPTEAEWEYCCRAGTTSEFSFGPSLTCGMAHFSYSYHSNSYCGGQFGQSSTANVGSYPDNPWQLFDMHGNVWEWCLDSWDGSANYPSSAVSDPYVSSGPYRVVRGGSWLNDSFYCRSAFRGSYGPVNAFRSLGFRVCLAPVLVP